MKQIWIIEVSKETCNKQKNYINISTLAPCFLSQPDRVMGTSSPNKLVSDVRDVVVLDECASLFHSPGVRMS